MLLFPNSGRLLSAALTRVVTVFLLFSLIISSAFSAIGSWSQIGPEGGTAASMAVDPTDPKTVYVGAFGGIYKSTDGGASWKLTIVGFPKSVRVFAVVLNPVNPSIVYAGVGGHGIYKSTNGGASWSAVNTGLSNRQVRALAIDPKSPNTLYTGTLNGGVFKTTDGGLSWSALSISSTSLSVFNLVIDPVNTSIVYATTSGKGIYKSVNGGVSWSPINVGLTTLYVNALAIDPKVPAVLYAGTSSGVFKTIDGGASWQAKNIPGLIQKQIATIIVDNLNTNNIYIGFFNANSIFKSIDGGENWATFSTGLPGGVIESLTLDPVSPSTLYTGVRSHGIFKSTNGGATWSEANNGFRSSYVSSVVQHPTTPSIIYAATMGSGVKKSTDGGITWISSNTGLTGLNINTLVMDPSSPGTLYAGTDSRGIFKTIDSGTTWVATVPNAINARAFTIAIDPRAPNTLYAGVVNLSGMTGVIKSTDAGATWVATDLVSKSGVYLGFVNSLTIDSVSSKVYAGIFGKGVHVTSNGGASWTALNAGLGNLYVNSIALDPATSDPKTMYVGTSGGIYKSVTSGSSWSLVRSGWTNTLLMNSTTAGTIYAGSFTGILKSDNGGSNWTALNRGLNHINIQSIKVNTGDGNSLFVGTGDGGIYSFTFSDTSPVTFTFKDIIDAPLATLVTSNEIVVQGINTGTPISIVGGEYSVNGGGFSSNSGSVSNGDSIVVRTTSASEGGATVNATLTVGDASDTFSVTTVRGPDSIPDQFGFKGVKDVEPGSFVISNTIQVTGINTESPISIAKGRYSINGGPYNARVTTVKNGDKISVIVRAWNHLDTSNSATLTIGGVSATFTVYTKRAKDEPKPEEPKTEPVPDEPKL